jgi:hypothetical protein
LKGLLVLSPSGSKHLIGYSLSQTLDLTKKIFISYGSTNHHILYHLNIKTSSLYANGIISKHSLTSTENRDKMIILENSKIIDSAEIDKNSILLKGANALSFENRKFKAAVLAADENGGTYGNFYIKAISRGAKVIIPVGLEKMVPTIENVSQGDYEKSMGYKCALLEFSKGDIFTEIDALKASFNLNAKVIASGGIYKNQGSVVIEIEGTEKDIDLAFSFANKYNQNYIY